MAAKRLRLPIVPPPGEACAHCTEQWRSHVLAIGGVQAAEVNRDEGQLVVTYDPAQVSPERLLRESEAAGTQMLRDVVHKVLALRGVKCAHCATQIEEAVRRLPGVVHASVSFPASHLYVAYDSRHTSRATVVAEVERLGYHVEEADVPLRTGVVQVGGMHCGDCARRVEQVVMALPGAHAVTVNLASGKAEVCYDPAMLAPDQVVRALREAGYEARVDGGPGPIAAPFSFWARSRRLFFTLVCGIIIVAGFLAQVTGTNTLLAHLLYLVAVLVGGFEILRKAVAALRTRLATDIHFLMSLAVAGALGIGAWSEAAAVVFLFSVAELLESYIMDRTRHAIRELTELAPKQAVVRREGREFTLPVQEIHPGEVIVVRPGERLAMDGTVVSGTSTVNEAPITGEPTPVEKSVGDLVYGGSINGSGALEVQVSKEYSETTLARIVRLVEAAQAHKAPIERLVDRFARAYTPLVIALAILLATLPPLALGGSFHVWFYRALALLIIACPCALVISTPVSMLSGIVAAARGGVLVKGGAYLEEIGRVRAIAFDKTGTLTQGAPDVVEIVPLAEYSSAEILRLAAAIESRSEHALAEAIRRKAYCEGVRWTEPGNFVSLTGQGVQARVDGEIYYVGHPRLFQEKGVPLESAQEHLWAAHSRGCTALLLGTQTRLLGLILASDQPRGVAGEAIRALKAQGIERTVMLTGDHSGAAAAIAHEIGVDEVHAELLPHQKVEAIQHLLGRYGHVAMVGDGVNDAPALAAASVGIAMGAMGSDVALETADAALMSDDLLRLPYLVELSRRTLRTIRQNIALSIAVKAAFVAFAFFGAITLWLAVVADMGTSLVVTANGLRLLRVARRHPVPSAHAHPHASACEVRRCERHDKTE